MTNRIDEAANAVARETVLLEGALNFRDVGGLPTVDGRRVLRRRLFRSESLAKLTDNDLAIIKQLEIRLLVDLRTEDERLRLPNRWPTDHEAEFLNISASDRNGDFRRILTEDLSPAGAQRAMMANYRAKPQAFIAFLPALFSRIADPRRLPAIIHCHAGKDRTGFAIALILGVLGVTREAILADYALTSKFWSIDATVDAYMPFLNSLTDKTASLDTARALNIADPAYLDAGLEAIDQEYGSIAAYLEGHAGVTPVILERMRGLFLE